MDGFQTTYEQLLKAEIVKAEMEMSQALGAAGGIKGESSPSAKGSQRKATLESKETLCSAGYLLLKPTAVHY